MKVTVLKAIVMLDFFVVINRAGTWTSDGNYKVTGSLTSYGTVIQETDADVDK